MSDNDFIPTEPEQNEGQEPTLPEPIDQPKNLGHITTPPTSSPTSPADDNAMLSALRNSAANLRALNQRIEELEKEKAARDRADEAARSAVWTHPPTHVLVLSNGQTVETANPSVTHHSDEDGIYPVVSRHVINPE